jgi:hypothetical protein
VRIAIFSLQIENYRAGDEDVDVWILQILEGPRDEANLNDCLYSGRYIFVLQCLAVTVNSQGSRPTNAINMALSMSWNNILIYRASPVQLICLLPLLCRTQMMARYAVMEFTK